MPKWVKKLAGTGSLYTDKSRMKKAKRGFYKMQNYEDKIYYSLGEAVTEQTQAISQAVQKTLENNGGVGIMTGYYDQNLSILSVSNLLLHSTGHTFDTFMEQTKGSLKNFFMTRKIYWSETVFCSFTEQGKHRSLQQTVQ